MPSGVYVRTEKNKINIGLSKKGKTPWNKGKTGLQVAWNKGIPRTKETKEKLSKSLTGRKSPCGMKGKKHSIETKEKMSKSHGGSKNFLFIDGRSNNKKYISWIKNKRNRLKYAIAKKFGSHTYGDWELLKKQYNYTCPCCGLSEPFNQKSKYLTEDHIIPLSKGGSDLIENIQPLCLSCNIKKHTLIIKY